MTVNLAGMSYQLQIRFRQLVAREVLHFVLPVGGRMVGFDLDGAPFAGYSTGLVKEDGKSGCKLPGAVLGNQIKDFRPHELDITVRLQGDSATITILLDARPFYQWSGPIVSLSQLQFWASPPGTLAIGTMSADWTVNGMRVRRLE